MIPVAEQASIPVIVAPRTVVHEGLSEPLHTSRANRSAGSHRPYVLPMSRDRDQHSDAVQKMSMAGVRVRAQALRTHPVWSLVASGRGLIALSLVIGVGAGLGAIVFRALIVAGTEVFTGHHDFSAAGYAANPHVPWLGIAFVVVAPIIGGLLYGPLVAKLAPEARGHGVPEVMLAVAGNEGRIRARVPFVKSVASAVCIASGGSVGREGPITQIGSAIGSIAGQLTDVSPQTRRLLVACGAAAGISATFNAPIAGVFFALELILRDFQARAFGIVVLSSVTATAVGRIAFGDNAFLTLPHFHVVSGLEYPLYAALGIAAAFVAITFVGVLYRFEDFADRVWRGPESLRPAVGGLALGMLLLALPQMYGVGYPVMQNSIGGHYVVGLLLLFMAGKVIATSLTMAIGGSGGVFAPALFIGATLGTAFGIGAHDLLPSLTAPPGAYGLVGMGAVFAAAAGAPITAVIIVFELTGDYSVILPLMVAVVVAEGLGRLLSPSTVYTRKLLRRGIDIDRVAGPLVSPAPELAEAVEARVGTVSRGGNGTNGAEAIGPARSGAQR